MHGPDFQGPNVPGLNVPGPNVSGPSGPGPNVPGPWNMSLAESRACEERMSRAMRLVPEFRIACTD